MKRALVVVLALMLPLVIINSADAAPRQPSGSMDYLEELAPAAGYQGAAEGNKIVDNVYFTVTSDNIPKFAQLRLLIACFDDSGNLVYKSTGTPRKNMVDTDFAVSLLNSIPSYPDNYLAPTESGACDATLYYDTWTRKDLYQYGGELDTLPGLFTITPRVT